MNPTHPKMDQFVVFQAHLPLPRVTSLPGPGIAAAFGSGSGKGSQPTISAHVPPYQWAAGTFTKVVHLAHDSGSDMTR